MKSKRKGESETGAIVSFVILLVVGIGFLMWVGPVYMSWVRGMQGKGLLMQAEYEKQISVEQAKAEVEAAKLRAEAIAIVGEAAKKFPEYRTQEFIGAFADAIKSGTVEKIIYVPTEANIPIVESPRR